MIRVSEVGKAEAVGNLQVNNAPTEPEILYFSKTSSEENFSKKANSQLVAPTRRLKNRKVSKFQLFSVFKAPWARNLHSIWPPSADNF